MSASTPWLATARLHRRLWTNCLVGVGEHLWQRPAKEVNAIGYIALHLIDSRHLVLRALERPIANPFAKLLKEAPSMAELAEQPDLAALAAAWATVSAALDEALEYLPPERLDEPRAHRFHIEGRTLGGAIAFLFSHEAYHIGQMALLRRTFGLQAMRYEESGPR